MLSADDLGNFSGMLWKPFILEADNFYDPQKAMDFTSSPASLLCWKPLGDVGGWENKSPAHQSLRKDFGGRYGSPYIYIIEFLYLSPAWKVLLEASRVFQKTWWSWWWCTLVSSPFSLRCTPTYLQCARTLIWTSGGWRRGCFGIGSLQRFPEVLKILEMLEIPPNVEKQGEPDLFILEILWRRSRA